ncbi:hypothetical protein DFH06DRAFT_1291559 [Mycena polygramma]|nr:hypothetical protein DFH06DRAFT_1291559 [Mycena polygramma]
MIFMPISSATLSLLLSAVAVLASPHQARTHKSVAKRLESFSIDKRAALNTTNQVLTFYDTNTGPDACTGKNHQDSDYYVAMDHRLYGDDGSACCGKNVSITANGKTTTATCVDECMTCDAPGSLDLTKGLFQFFSGGDLNVGVLTGTWHYVDGSPGGETTTSTTKNTTTPTAQKKTTSTPTATPEEKTTKAPTATHDKPATTSTPAAESSMSAASDDGDDCKEEDEPTDSKDTEDEEDCDDEGDDETSSSIHEAKPTTTSKVKTAHASASSTAVVPSLAKPAVAASPLPGVPSKVIANAGADISSASAPANPFSGALGSAADSSAALCLRSSTLLVAVAVGAVGMCAL